MDSNLLLTAEHQRCNAHYEFSASVKMIILHSVYYSYPLILPSFVSLTRMEGGVSRWDTHKKQTNKQTNQPLGKWTEMSRHGVKQHALNKLKWHWKQQLYDNNKTKEEEWWVYDEKEQNKMTGKKGVLFKIKMQAKKEIDWGTYLHEPKWRSISSQNPHKRTWLRGHTLLRKLGERVGKTIAI